MIDVTAPDLIDGIGFVAADVCSREAMQELANDIGEIDVLMNNAGIGPGTSVLDGANWQRTLDVNLGGIINGTQAFGPKMVASGKPGLIINTGSKQGITTPPGNPAYNVSKAGVKAFTEALQHELRNGRNPAVTAHLLIPGFVWTGMTKGNRTEKPAGAWTAEQTVDFMIDSVNRGDFYILCPDNDVPRALDEKRMAWAAGDIIDNRPPLSRWHPDYAQAFRPGSTTDHHLTSSVSSGLRRVSRMTPATRARMTRSSALPSGPVAPPLSQAGPVGVAVMKVPTDGWPLSATPKTKDCVQSQAAWKPIAHHTVPVRHTLSVNTSPARKTLIRPIGVSPALKAWAAKNRPTHDQRRPAEIEAACQGLLQVGVESQFLGDADQQEGQRPLASENPDVLAVQDDGAEADAMAGP
ncbi:MAG: SDR family oxidoreductase [Asticcacaulis sp.]